MGFGFVDSMHLQSKRQATWERVQRTSFLYANFTTNVFLISPLGTNVDSGIYAPPNIHDASDSGELLQCSYTRQTTLAHSRLGLPL
ncbi:hypothetical protein V1508DRAFT_400322 [Lipomyces doorenjongii]|uniref:uncharacterized protein n=1 Tax=Lipomyces doorenjongii TaxID=383834 RepID=UPI0034CFFD68